MSAAPVRVLWLVKTLAHGGAARLLWLTARELDRSRFDVEVAYVLDGMDALAPALQAEDVVVRCLGGRGRTGGAGWIGRLRALLRDGGFDVCHTHSPLPAAAARMVAPRSLPLVHTEHNVWPRYHWATRLANAVTYRRNAAAIAVSQAVAASIQTPAPVQVLYHGIDEGAVRRGEAARREARRLLGLGHAEPVIGCVARLDPEKDHDTLLRSFSLLVEQRPEVRLVLVGGGPFEERLRQRATAAGLAGRVLFTGARDDVPRLLPAFDVFALTSRYEGLPLAVIEALATGIPCVVTAVGGMPEAVQDGRTGFVVQPQSAKAAAAALRKLLDDDHLRSRMGAEAAAQAARFSTVHATAQIQELYERVLHPDQVLVR